MKICLPLNKAESRCENVSELIKGLELEEIYLSKRKRKKSRCKNNSTDLLLDEDFFTKKKKWENDSELTKGSVLDQIFLSKRKSQKKSLWKLKKTDNRIGTWWRFIYCWTSQKVVVKKIQNWQKAWNLMKIYLPLNKCRKKVVVKTIQNWQMAWNLMKIYLWKLFTTDNRFGTWWRFFTAEQGKKSLWKRFRTDTRLGTWWRLIYRWQVALAENGNQFREFLSPVRGGACRFLWWIPGFC